MKFLILNTLLLLSSYCHSFLLIDPAYKLASPKNVVVNIAQGGCQANGISNDELMSAIKESIDRYWNTVTDSELKMFPGEEVSRVGVGAADPGEILVYCVPLGMGGASGVTTNSNSKGSAEIRLNGTTFVPGGYIDGALEGVLTHEMGHAVGLHHSGDPASVMTYEAHEWGPEPKYLAQDDRDGVAYLYPRKGKVEGLIPGCSAFAGDGSMESGFGVRGLFLEMFLLGLTVCFIRFVSRRVRRSF